MNTQHFEQCKSAFTKLGLELDPRITQGSQNGIPGMYAVESIPAGTRLCAIPLSLRLPHARDISFESVPEASQEQMKRIHSVARALNGASPEYESYFKFFDGKDYLENQCVYYYTDTEFEWLKKLNPILYSVAINTKQTANNIAQTLMHLDPGLNEEYAVSATLNFFSRSWSYGFLPIIDFFNHSLHSNVKIQAFDDGSRVGYVSNRNYEAGEEIKVAYGTKDMYRFALAYNFFDPNDLHLIDYGLRVTQVVKDPNAIRALQALGQHYRIALTEQNDALHMRVLEDGMFFLEQGPNQKLVEFLSALANGGKPSQHQGRAMHPMVPALLRQTLQSLLSANAVEHFKEDDVPQKLSRFFLMLKKERAMLETNLNMLSASTS